MTIKDCLKRAAAARPDAVALKYKRGGAWCATTFKELLERAWHVAEMLDVLGVRPGDRVAICLENSPEWYETYHGIVGIGAVAVPIDTKLREQEVAHIFRDCGVSAAFCSARHAELVAAMDSPPRTLREVVVLDAGDGGPAQQGAYHAYEALRTRVSEKARSAERAFDRPGPSDASPASLLYTSGTTGRQKGAVLTHRNFIANAEGIVKAVGFLPDDSVLLVLPLHHSFAFTCTLVVPAYVQCHVSIAEGLKTLKSDMAESSPTVLLAVPLLLEKMLARIVEGIEARPAAKLLYRHGLARLVGLKVKAELGGALRLVVSGGAPISPDTLQAWRRLGFLTLEGYGITETAPVLTVNPPGAPRLGTVGLPLEGVDIRILDPDLDGVGEILARGENVMPGYHNNPVETAKALVDGWFHTGDLGRFDEKGYLVISGRKKSLIVNREGKNIYPEEVERQVMQSRYVLECLAMGYRDPGDRAGERVGLVVVPDLAVFGAMEERGGARLSDREIADVVRGDVRRQLEAIAGYKRPRRIEIRFDEFEKTTTQKIKRHLYAIDTSAP